MRKLKFTLLLISLALALLAAPAYAAGGTIRGKMVNGTANGGSVAGVEVSLTTYFGQTERNKSTATTDAEGSFQFSGLDTGRDYSYEVTTNYQKGDYSAPRVSFSSTEETKEVTLNVYDSTTDENAVKVQAKHYLLSVGAGQLEVSEILVLGNPTDRTYIGNREIGPDQRETVRYQPPAAAKNVEYGEGLMSCCIVKQGAGFVDTMPVKPGESQSIYSYRLPYSGTSLSFSTTLQQEIERVQVLVPNTGVRASVSGLASHGTQNIQGTSYLVFGGDKLPADTTIDVDLQGLPAGQLADSPLLVMGIAIATLAALGAVFYVLRRRSRPMQAPAYGYHAPVASRRAQRASTGDHRGSGVGKPAMVELEKRDLLAAIANLDELFDAGQINRKDYERLRAEKKARLLHLMQQGGSKRTPARV